MGAKLKYTDEEREAIKKSQYQLIQKPKEEARHKRLAPFRFESGRMSKKERREFKSEIREVNQKRFEEILDSPIWKEIFREDQVDYQAKQQKTEARRRARSYVTYNDMEKAMLEIWGGVVPNRIEEEREYTNPYKQNETE